MLARSKRGTAKRFSSTTLRGSTINQQNGLEPLQRRRPERRQAWRDVVLPWYAPAGCRLVRAAQQGFND